MGTDLLLRLDTLDPASRDQVIQAQRLAVLGQFFCSFRGTTNDCPVINISVLTAEASCGFSGECLPDPAFQLGLFGDEHGAHHRPVMRTVFITEQAQLERRVREALTREAAGRFRGQDADVDDWAIVGSPAEATEKLAEYRESLGLDYLIARGRIQGIESEQQIRSHELLMKLSH